MLRSKRCYLQARIDKKTRCYQFGKKSRFLTSFGRGGYRISEREGLGNCYVLNAAHSHEYAQRFFPHSETGCFF